MTAPSKINPEMPEKEGRQPTSAIVDVNVIIWNR
jgi:hypothetical protein